MPTQPHCTRPTRQRPTRQRLARFSAGRPAAIAAWCIAVALFATACGGSVSPERVSVAPVTAEADAASEPASTSQQPVEAAGPETEVVEDEVDDEPAEPAVEAPAAAQIASDAGNRRLKPEYFADLVAEAGQDWAECVESGLSDAAIAVFNALDEPTGDEVALDEKARVELTVVAQECGAALPGFEDQARADPNYQRCADGDMVACDDLYLDSPIGSEAEDFGFRCGGILTLEEAVAHEDSCELL